MTTEAERIYRRFVLLAVLIIAAFVISSPMTASADDKEYNVNSARFEVVLRENGDAVISEHWNITYQKGDFTRFYKDIYNSPNQLEYIRQIKVAECKINGKNAARSDSLDRKDGNFYIDAQADRFSVNWFKTARNETVDYEITYLIPNSVKLDENNKAVFCYRLIGENFPKTVDDVQTLISIPTGSDSLGYTVSTGSASVYANGLEAESKGHSGMYKVRFEMSPDGFSGLMRVIDVDIPENITRAFEDNSGKYVAVSMMSLFGVIGAVVVASAVVPHARKRKARKMLEDDPGCFRNSAERVSGSGMPFSWLFFPPFRHAMGVYDYSMLFYAEIFDLVNKGLITVTEEGLILSQYIGGRTGDAAQDTMDTAFMDILCELFPPVSQNGETMIFFDSINEQLAAKSYNASLLTLVNAWRTQSTSALKESTVYASINNSGQIKELKKELEMWTKYAKNTDLSVSIYDCFELIKRKGNIDPYTVFMLIYGKREKMVSVSEDNYNDMYNFLYYVESSYDSYAASSSSSSSGGSSCSGCSSCSSCGGCGGGGAD